MDKLSEDAGLLSASVVRTNGVFERKGQRYVCVSLAPHRRRDGADTLLATVESRCADCGAAFRFTVSAMMEPKRDLNRRCGKHKRPGSKCKSPRLAARA